MRTRWRNLREYLLVLCLCVTSAGAAPQHIAAAQQTATAPARERALPLKRFADSVLTTTDAQGFYKMPTGIGDDYFDGKDPISRVRRHLRIARALGVHYLRCGFSWNGIEPQQGKYEWRFWDQLVTEAERAGIRLTPYVAYTPEWAARSRQEFWQQPPRDTKFFADFMKKIALRYRGRIQTWELWNEPDLKEYWQGTPDEFADLVRQGAAAVRRGNPDAVIILGGMSRGPSAFFERLMTTDNIADTVDVIAQHAYPESWDPERAETIFFDWTSRMRELITKSGYDVDFWLNEIGYPDYRFSASNASKWGDTDVYYAYEHTASYQATFLFKSFVMARATGHTSLTTWYRVDDFPLSEKRLNKDYIHRHLGVVDVHARPKPDYHALQFYNRLFRLPVRVVDETRKPQHVAKSQAIVNVFERTDSRVIVAAWLRSSERDEVAIRTGMLKDQRSEIVSVSLPCRRVPGIQYYTATGQKLTSAARLQQTQEGATLERVPLHGDRVFVAVAQCVK